jgi:VanZ family protein
MARWALYLGVAVSLALSVYPGDLHLPLLSYSDKFDHAVIFFLMAVCSKAGWHIRTVWLIGLLLFYGALIEGVQLFLPAHTSDWKDFLADIVGMIPGILMGNWIGRRCR